MGFLGVRFFLVLETWNLVRKYTGVMTIFFYKGLARYPEIANTPLWVLPNTWSLKQVRETQFGTNVFDDMLLNAAKCQVYSFYRFWVITEKTIRGLRGTKLVKLPPTRLGFTRFFLKKLFSATLSLSTLFLRFTRRPSKIFFSVFPVWIGLARDVVVALGEKNV